MAVLIIFFAGILGTSMMTVFSHMLELVTKEKLNEAHLLNGLIDKAKPTNYEVNKNHYFGWVIHYAIGLCMASGLYAYYFYIAQEINIWKGIILGFILGVIGIAGWSLMIGIHANPPKINWNFFFVQLMVAHIIFGMTVTWILARFVF